MTVENGVDDPSDQFPKGMRVLAVDDDPTCLMVLETLLRRCQYHVTTTSQAVKALTLLRENKFDLVISDVHMPDMDGFKLLELVGLEMDLPVIMLSANGDTKLVMKGISHGACDYLLKPVRIEELKNIWQHVIRRKKLDPKEKNKTRNLDKPNSDSGNGLGLAGTGNPDQNGKLNKKRKDQDDDEDEEQDNGNDNDDPSAQKKARVVWSVDLHRKFVAAVNQLGIDKAVPKKILDLMNVEKLTRENVASHLQKYRLYLKRISCVANQQANMVAALGSTDPSFLRMGSVSGVGHLQSLSGSGQFTNNAFRSFPPPGGIISRLNTPAGMNVHGFPSSGVFHLGQSQNLNNSAAEQMKFQPSIVPVNQKSVQGMPASIGLDPLQHNKGVISVQNMDSKTNLPISNKLLDPRSRVISPSSHTPPRAISNNALMLEARPQDAQGVREFESPISSISSQHSDFGFALLDQGRYTDNWSSAVQPSGIQTNSYPPSECFRPTAIPPSDNMTSLPLQGGNLSVPSSISSLPNQSHNSMPDMHSQGGIFTSRPGHISNDVPFHSWDDNNLDGSYHSNVICSTISTVTPVGGAVGPAGHTPSNSTLHRNLDFNFGDPIQMKSDGAVNLIKETSLKQHHGNILNRQNSQHSRFSNNVGSLEDLVSSMMKQDQDEMKLLDGDFICDNYSGGISM